MEMHEVALTGDVTIDNTGVSRPLEQAKVFSSMINDGTISCW
jgi:hypothetical protein